MALETTADNLYFQVSAGVIPIIPNGLINLNNGETTVKLTTQQHLFRLSRNAVVTCYIHVCFM